MNSSDFLEIHLPIVLDLLKTQLDSNLAYHDYRHTQDVMQQAVRIGEAEKLSASEMIELQIAALYHDAGFLFNRKNHEDQSVVFFKEHADGKLAQQEIEKISQIILATCMPQHPNNLVEQVMCDADLDYLGRNDFDEISDRLFRELVAHGDVQSKQEWDKIQVRFLSAHSFHTPSQRSLREPVKQSHLAAIEARVG